MILRVDDVRLSEALVSTLRAGGVAIVPCDTIYGIIGRVPDTEERIRRIKGRGETNPFLMLVSAESEAAAIAEKPLDRRVASLWPAPLTVVLRSAGGTVAVRLPADPFLRSIIQSLGAPIYSTSVNRSGRPALWRISDIIDEFASDVDLLADAGDRPSGLPSTILDTTERPYHILRQGAFQVPPELLT